MSRWENNIRIITAQKQTHTQSSGEEYDGTNDVFYGYLCTICPLFCLGASMLIHIHVLELSFRYVVSGPSQDLKNSCIQIYLLNKSHQFHFENGHQLICHFSFLFLLSDDWWQNFQDSPKQQVYSDRQTDSTIAVKRLNISHLCKTLTFTLSTSVPW